MLKDLFDDDFVQHYNITSSNVAAVEHCVRESVFDLEDDENDPIKNSGDGKVTIKNTIEGMDVLEYEHFINQCNKPKSFANGRKRCDFVLTSQLPKDFVCLLELSSAIGDSAKALFNLPINHHQEGAVSKAEKAEKQLLSTLETMMEVPAIKDNLQQSTKRVCLFAYRLFPRQSAEIRAANISDMHARYLRIEAMETKDDGARLNSPDIEKYGFEYRRISHEYTFNYLAQ